MKCRRCGEEITNTYPPYDVCNEECAAGSPKLSKYGLPIKDHPRCGNCGRLIAKDEECFCQKADRYYDISLLFSYE